MGKRGDKRRKRAREKRPRTQWVDILDMGPYSLEYNGEDVVARFHEDHPLKDEFENWRKTFAENLPSYVADLEREITDLLAPHDAFEVLAMLQFAGVYDIVSRQDRGGPELTVVELAASLLVQRDGRDAVRPAVQGDYDLQRLQAGLQQLLSYKTFLVLDRAAVGSTDDEFDNVRGHAQAMRLVVRGPSHPWQERDTLRDLFDIPGTEEALRASVGLTLQNALALEEAVSALGLERMDRRAAEARGFERRVQQALNAIRSGRSLRDGPVRRIAERLSGLGRRDAARWMRHAAVAWLAEGVSDAMSFTAEEVAERAHVPVDAGRAFLDGVSTRFGLNRDLGRPTNIEDIRDRPLLVDSGGRYFCVSHHNLLWGIRPFLERVLKKDARAFAQFERHRRNRAEDRAVQALRTALRPDAALRSVYYDIQTSEKTQRAEVDGLLRLDDTLFVVEVKASSMRASGRRGAPASMRDWLRREVGGGAQQARRARTVLAAEPVSQLYDESGRPVEFSVDGIRHVFEIIVLLEDLPAVAPATWQLAAAGVLPDEPIPWVVSLHELEVLCDLVEWPAQLVHYLMRRRRLDEQRGMWAMEELDYFGHYLTRRLFWPDREDASMRPSLLASQTEPIDRYLEYEQGLVRKSAKRPRMKLHREVRALIDALDRLDAAGRLAAQIVLLEVDPPSAERIAAGAQRLRRSAERSGQGTDMTLMFDGFGVTVMATPAAERETLGNQLSAYCRLKKHQMRADAWVGFGAYEGPPEPAQLAVIFDAPWAPDEQLDELVKTLPTAQAPAPESEPGRVRWWRDGTWR